MVIKRRVFAFLGTPGLIAIAIAILLLLPFDVVAVTRLTGWEWRIAVAALVILNLIPLAGQVICVGLAVLGAYYLGQEHLTPRNTATDNPPAKSAPGPDPVDSFAEWKRTVGGPTIQDECIRKAQSHGLVEGRQIEQMARVCACYGTAAIAVLEQSDVVDNVVQPSPALEAKLTNEARRICQR